MMSGRCGTGLADELRGLVAALAGRGQDQFSFNRDPKSAATRNPSTCKERRWQPTAGSAFAARRIAECESKLAPRREVAGMLHTKGNARRGNLALGRG
jgi:hypothetical protein